MSSVQTVPDGFMINPDELPQSINYNGDGTVNYIEVNAGGRIYRQTLTYTSGKVTGISAWVKQ
ncbi:hypothetical protein [Chitinibacter tainanensis]|uniref:hypothetical protein n=1 Tax=Chitinibacter tainanensis TaxID=230667 RepID=UPI0023534D07|nr:hypothetical protein [Chitinibacter tainanensis]